MATKSLRAVAILAAAMALSGCGHMKSKVPASTNDEGPFRIGKEDVLDISVWRDPDLSRTAAVRPDGMITLPIAGELKAAGKTPVELAKDIKEKLSPYVQDPKVSVIVREVNSPRVFVTGEVARPGSYPVRGSMSVLQAIALAGGFTDFANGDGIVVIRQGNEGGQIPVRYSDLISAGEDTQDVRAFSLRAGDTIVVP
jgi:polysaccharide biosynthesis/export protein